VEYEFKAREWESLSIEQRVRRCRLMAEEARLLAEGAPEKLKEEYRAIAADWLQLAIAIARSATT
jgi:hypothetical protein